MCWVPFFIRFDCFYSQYKKKKHAAEFQTEDRNTFFFNNQHHAAIRLQGALHFCTKLKLPHYPEIVVNKHGQKSEGGFKANTQKCKLKKNKRIRCYYLNHEFKCGPYLKCCNEKWKALM